MPLQTQRTLIHALLLWTIILSIVQVVFIILFFTAGPFQRSSAETSKHTMPLTANNASSSLNENELLLGKGKMLTFGTTGYENHHTKWIAKNPDTRLMSEQGGELTIKKDGYYFIGFQMTLCSCEIKHKVSLEWKSKQLLWGWINTASCSTGFLGKAAELSAGGSLKVTISPTPDTCLNTTESYTYLDIIYMVKP